MAKTTRILLLLILFLSITTGYATEPYPTRILTNIQNTKSIKLQPKWEEALVISDNETNSIKVFSIENILKDDFSSRIQISTAGIIWYDNSITFLDKQEQHLIIRLKWGELVVVNLDNNTLSLNIPGNLKKEINDTIYNKALEFLVSKDPQERQTGAIVCGQLRIRDAIPNLKKLLKDKEFFTTYSGNNPGIIVLYVRKAAKEAMLALGENVENVITDLPEKEHLKYDKKSGRYIVIIEDDIL